ncbi:hypothetical protein BUALT_Bualt13G0085000 [Buddleja alternifolia]|uniref:Uncharacterized protein n=1 Tax=Buddleja alternifolia TaxID=168488 RepID=A0AAV6WSI4_9LAMI|nr:hypothetical protein BUALT_Bualt13G0085000 [Buddleja alternifolia]
MEISWGAIWDSIASLGALARIGTLLPLHYTSWSYMPKEKLDGIWEDVKEQAIQNAKNRAKKKYLHRTGKTPFPLFKQEMRHEGKDTTKFDIFVCSRSGGQGIHADGETSTLVVSAKHVYFPIAGQIEELRRLKDEVTHEKNGVEQIKLELIKQKEDFAKEKEQVVDEVRREFKDQLEHMKVIMEFFTSLIDPAALQSALSRVTAQGLKFTGAIDGTHERQLNTDENIRGAEKHSQHIPNVPPSHEVVAENILRDTSIDDYIPDKVTTGNMNENDIYDCSPVEVGSNVILFFSEIPKEIVAKGVLLSMDPNEKIDEIALGHEFVKVVIRKAIQPAYFLMRPRRGVSTVREAVGKSVAWEYVNVMEK